jgi:hypothetical protein
MPSEQMKPVQTKEEILDFLRKQEHILEINYEDIGVDEDAFNETISKLPEQLKSSAARFMFYLKSPVIKDNFSGYGQRRQWGDGVLNELNAEAGKLYKSNKISQSNFRKISGAFVDFEYDLPNANVIFKRSKELQKEAIEMFGNEKSFETLSFEEKKKVSDKFSEFAKSVCNSLIENFNK